MKNDLATSCFRSILLLLSQDPTRSSSTSTVTRSSGRFGIPVDAVVKYFRECSTVGQTKVLINNTNYMKLSENINMISSVCVCHGEAKCKCLQCNEQDKCPPFSMNTHSSSPHSEI